MACSDYDWLYIGSNILHNGALPAIMLADLFLEAERKSACYRLKINATGVADTSSLGAHRLLVHSI